MIWRGVDEKELFSCGWNFDKIFVITMKIIATTDYKFPFGWNRINYTINTTLKIYMYVRGLPTSMLNDAYEI